jgi:hypothetical protein
VSEKRSFATLEERDEIEASAIALLADFAAKNAP